VSLRLPPVAAPAERLAASPSLTPFLKWPGGKSQELMAIAAAAPPLTGRFIDPFVGGGSVLLAVPGAVEAWANDAARDLIELYRAAAEERRAFRAAVSGVARTWDELGAFEDVYRQLADAFLGRTSMADGDAGSGPALAHALGSALAHAGPGLDDVFATRLTRDLPAKFERMRRIQVALGRQLSDRDLLANIEGAVRAALYMAIRARYNRARLSATWSEARLADFLFLREFAYAAMFRFNARGEFNVPYGGLTYNRKSFGGKLDVLFSATMLTRLQNTTWRSADFEEFLLEVVPATSDFVFVDPPYDTDFSDYDGMSFGRDDQQRLARVLDELPARVMVVVKDTSTIRRCYRADRWRVASADRTYMWTIKSRNDRATTHLTITNY
jgi:DNA adenine methylase